MVPVKFSEVEKELEPFSIWDKEGNEYAGVFSQFRIQEDTIPEGTHMFHLRHSDSDDMIPCTLEKFVGVNFYGTFITRKEVPLKDGSSVDPYLHVEDWSFTEGGGI